MWAQRRVTLGSHWGQNKGDHFLLECRPSWLGGQLEETRHKPGPSGGPIVGTSSDLTCGVQAGVVAKEPLAMRVNVPGIRQESVHTFFSLSCEQGVLCGNQCPLTGMVLRARNDVCFSSPPCSLPPLAAGM